MITLKAPAPLLEAIAYACEEQQVTRSELIRRAVDRELARLERAKARAAAKRKQPTRRRV